MLQGICLHRQDLKINFLYAICSELLSNISTMVARILFLGETNYHFKFGIPETLNYGITICIECICRKELDVQNMMILRA